MKWHTWLWPALIASQAWGQQGFAPPSRVINAPYTALMHRADVAAHSAIRPYLREDLARLPGADTAAPPALWPWLERTTDPTHRLYGSPLLDLLAGFSANDRERIKYRTGLGGWLAWNASERWTFSAAVQGWMERPPDYLAAYAATHGVAPGEGRAHFNGQVLQHCDWSAYADHKAGKYFHFTLGKGKQFFGEGYRSLFLSDEASSYPYFRITTTAWHMRYVNLFTVMRDLPTASRAPGPESRKYTSMHYLSWNISKRVNAAFFESVIWKDNDPSYPRGFDIAYLNPVIFLRPVEFGIGSPDNVLMGAALNVKVGRVTLLYSQFALDEFLLKHVRAGDGWYGNKQALQFGVLGHGAFGVKGLDLRGELNYVRPFMYTHNDPEQNYAHLGQPLAHPYEAGFLEGLIQGQWRTGNWLIEDVFSWAVMGQDTGHLPADNHGNNIFIGDSHRPLEQAGRIRNFGFRLGDPSRATVFHNELRLGRLIAPRSGLMLEVAWTLRIDDGGHGPMHTTNYLRAGLSTNLFDRHPFQVIR